MALSYTSAVERDVKRVRVAAGPLAASDVLLPLTSLLALLTIGLAYAGTAQTAAQRWPSSSSAPVNLNTVRDAAALEAILQPALPHEADRRFAAHTLFEAIAARREAGEPLANVGALADLTVPAASVDATPLLIDYKARLETLRERQRTRSAPPPDVLPILSGDALAALKPSLVVRTRDEMRGLVMRHAALYIGAFYAVLAIWRIRRVPGDVWLLAAVHLLTAIGFALLVSRVDPLRDTALFIRYTIGIVCGLAVMAAAALIDFRKAALLRLSYVPLVAAFVLSLLLLLFGDGPGTSRARVNLGPVQPIEAIRLLLAFFLAGYFAQRWELLRQVRSPLIGSRRVPAWLHLPRPEYIVPMAVGIGAALLFFALQRDLGPALFLSCLFLAMYAVARARIVMPLVGAGVLSIGFAIGYLVNLSDTLTARVRMWQSPWDNAVRGGDQIAQSLWAVATGGWHGTGLGFGDTRYLPAGHTDLVLSAVGEELGLIGLLAVAAVYAAITARGFRIALRAATDYGFFLALAITLFLIVPVLMMAAGVFGVMPLTGVVTPFLSYGGSAMVANLAGLGVLMAIDAQRSPAADTTPFRRSTMYLGATLTAAAVMIAVVMASAATVSADALATRPHLGVQADGMRRFQHNPRVLDVARGIPRGTIVDRRGLALATGNAGAVKQARADYARFGVTVDTRCGESQSRCYPLGAAAFHLLGNADSRVNWSAPNTSYVERDADARLRGFDDHATTVAVPASTGGESYAAIRRDYRELLPLLRHRYDPTHPAVRAVLDRPRDLKLTVDAPLQSRIGGILERYAARSKTGRAAAIVIDVESGQLLSIASYPFPVQNESSAALPDEAALLDRARYGLYPPGSTFKLVTAAAALDSNLGASNDTFGCAYLPNGRVGAKIAGWNRPVRDDVLDTRPHGRLRMHDGLVSSCNAYFAQLAIGVGPKALMEMAARAGIVTTPSASIQRMRDTLPQAGYGQGDVVATPLRMARVAAAIANRGVLRDVSWEDGRADAAGRERFVSSEAAHLLAQYMRDAVQSGTGRALRSHPMRIAGKTGTAEVQGAASHSWFVGFAPFDADARIAFAVIVENAGYGAAAAVPIAGEIVSAAADLGLIK